MAARGAALGGLWIAHGGGTAGHVTVIAGMRRTGGRGVALSAVAAVPAAAAPMAIASVSAGFPQVSLCWLSLARLSAGWADGLVVPGGRRRGVHRSNGLIT